MKRLRPALALLAALGCALCIGGALARAASTTARIAVLPDYTRGPGGDGAALLVTDEFDQNAPQQPAGLARWLAPQLSYPHPPTDAWYHLRLNFASIPRDYRGWDLELRVPFVNLDYARIQPRPNNYAALITPSATMLDAPPQMVRLDYAVKDLTGTLDIPMTPVRRRISLALTPLAANLQFGRTDDRPVFLVSGHVRFEEIQDYRAYTWDCARNRPLSGTNYYNTLHLLAAFDAPPGIDPDFFPYSNFKASYVLARVVPLQCAYDAVTGGAVDADFYGGVYTRTEAEASNRPRWDDVLESSELVTATNSGSTPRAAQFPLYALQLGLIALAPGDVLTVSVPGADIVQAEPAPVRAGAANGRVRELTYEGPLFTGLRLFYSPEAELAGGQLPSLLRAAVQPVEQWLLQLQGAPAKQPDWRWTVYLMPVVLALYVIARWSLLERPRGWFTKISKRRHD